MLPIMEQDSSIPKIHQSWKKVLYNELNSQYFKDLNIFLLKEKKHHTIFPAVENIFSAFTNGEMLSIIFFALLCGFFIVKLTPKSKNFLVLGVNAAFELIMKITTFIIKFTPYGVFGIVAVTVAEKVGDHSALLKMVKVLGMYMITVVGALAIHFVVVPTLTYI